MSPTDKEGLNKGLLDALSAYSIGAKESPANLYMIEDKSVNPPSLSEAFLWQ